MSNKKIHLNKDCLSGILAGVEKTSAVIRSTMGAKGRLVAIQTGGGGVVFTKDGANTARQIVLSDPLEDIGAKMVIEAAINTADQAGDGTTSTTVILHEIVKSGIAMVSGDHNQIVLANELDQILGVLTEKIKEMSTLITPEDVESLKNIALISANGDDEIATMVSKMVSEVGKDGIVSILDSGSFETRMDWVSGVKMESGLDASWSGYFINNQSKRTCEFDNPIIAITDWDFYKINQIAAIVEIAGTQNRPLVIIGGNFEGEALSALIYNNQQKVIRVCAIQAPGGGALRTEILHDIAAATGGVYLSDVSGHNPKKVTLDQFGGCRKITVSPGKTIITDGEGDVSEYIKVLEGQLENESNPGIRYDLESRIRKLSGGVGVIYVGDTSDSSHKEKMDRVEDSVRATQSALQEGIVPGGGAAYLALSKIDELNNYPIAGPVVRKALRAPMIQICENAGLNGQFHIENNSDFGYCVDVISEKRVVAIESGIIDPSKVVRCAIQNAFKNATTILRTSSSITIENK
jgi:chaperonin GroEL